ncbi:GIY-YIG nuclease family protein [Maribacter sp. 2210JD10-5]|uniref:GIY-YIG nuclease family protein n=1 Tax=Maribacter sp. 2210JD10-5 TaxID=3386272 RepID=UPI0039BD77CE
MDSPDSYRGKFPNFKFNVHFVYIIQSLEDGSFYVGMTGNLEARLVFHNDRSLNQGVIKNENSLALLFILRVENMRTARMIENHIKRMKSRKYIFDLNKYPEISLKLIKKYS